MGLELFAASILVNLALLGALGWWLAGRGAGRGRGRDADHEALKQEVVDLTTQLARVATTHARAVEERRDELLKTIETANEKIRRMQALAADLEVLAGRARAAGEPIARRAGARPVDPRSEEIRRLAAEGLPPAEIARRVGVGLGEIRLVLGLRDRGALE